MRDTRTIMNTSREEILQIMQDAKAQKEKKHLNLTFECKQCDKGFHPTRSWQTFCSQKCKTEFHNTQLAATLIYNEEKATRLEATVEQQQKIIDELRQTVLQLRK